MQSKIVFLQYRYITFKTFLCNSYTNFQIVKSNGSKSVLNLCTSSSSSVFCRTHSFQSTLFGTFKIGPELRTSLAKFKGKLSFPWIFVYNKVPLGNSTVK